MTITTHINGFDYLRVIAAFSVVWIHGCHTNSTMSELNILNNYAVPVFILVSIYLFGVKYDGKMINKITAINYILKKVGPQYIFWTIIYLLFRFFKSYLFNTDLEINFSTIFLGGSAVQLWFLPAIIIWHLFLIFYWDSVENTFIDIVLMFLVFVGGRYLMVQGYLMEGFLNCVAIYSGYIFSAKIIYQNNIFIKKVPSFIYFFCIVCSFILLILFGDYLWSIMFSLSVFLFFLSINISSQKVIRSMSKNSFGIYLVHFIFLQFIINGALFLKVSTSSILFTFSSIAGTFFASYTLSFIFSRYSILKKLV